MSMVLLALAGGAGAVTRFALDTLIARHSRRSVPVSTTLINVTACLFLGVLTGWAGRDVGGLFNDVVATGFLGGYSTFSTASLESAVLLIGGRIPTAIWHALGMLCCSIAAAIVGLLLGLSLAA